MGRMNFKKFGFEEKFRIFFENISDVIYIIDDNFKILDISPSVYKILGYKPEELIGKDIRELNILTPGSLKRAIENYLNQINGKEIPTEKYCFLSKKGERRCGDVFSSLIKKDGKIIGVLSIARDITEILKKEEEFIKIKEMFESFFENDLTGDFIAKEDGKILICNPSFLKIFGFFDSSEVLNHSLSELFDKKEDWEVLLSSVIKEKKLENFEIEMKKKDGKKISILSNIFGYFDEKNNLYHIQGSFFDITAKKKLEEEVLRTQKIEALGTLVAGIAHDFNNLLTIISGYLKYLNESCDCRDKKREEWKRAIGEATKRGIGLVNQLLNFAGRQRVKKEICDVNKIIKDLFFLTYETFPRNIVFELKLQEDVPKILCEEVQISQALLNLFLNSKDAMPKGGKINISTNVYSKDKLYERFGKKLIYDYIEIKVSDNGVGMDKETLGRIFEPFFTTKEFGKGTGLGLSLVYSIVKNHNGFIDVESEKGVGTTFYIFLPIEKKEIKNFEKKEVPLKEIKGKGETILIVEDEELILNLIKMTLLAGGYNIIETGDGAKAVKLYEENKDKISLVICDLGIPSLSGDEVFENLKKINPNIKFILISGLIEKEKEEMLLKKGVLEVIQKPFSIDELLPIIRKILG